MRAESEADFWRYHIWSVNIFWLIWLLISLTFSRWVSIPWIGSSWYIKSALGSWTGNWTPPTLIALSHQTAETCPVLFKTFTTLFFWKYFSSSQLLLFFCQRATKVCVAHSSFSRGLNSVLWLFRVFFPSVPSLSTFLFSVRARQKLLLCEAPSTIAVSAPTEADRRVLLSSANAEKRPLSCQGPYCVLKWFLHLLPASSPIFETHPFYCRTQLSGVSKISSTICSQRCN